MASSRKKKTTQVRSVRTGPSPDDTHDVVYFKRHVSDDAAQAVPGRDALHSWPRTVRSKAYAVLVAVATAPPKRFAGGGYWEATLSDADYAAVRALGEEFLSRNPRSVA